MDAEITMDWMGEALKALVRWFMPPKDMSDFPDAPPRLAYVDGVGGVGVWGAVGGAGGDGGDGGAEIDGLDLGTPIIAPYIQLPVVPTTPGYTQFQRPTYVFQQPIYDTTTIVAGEAMQTIFTTGEYTFDADDGTFDDTGVLNNG